MPYTTIQQEWGFPSPIATFAYHLFFFYAADGGAGWSGSEVGVQLLTLEEGTTAFSFSAWGDMKKWRMLVDSDWVSHLNGPGHIDTQQQQTAACGTQYEGTRLRLDENQIVLGRTRPVTILSTRSQVSVDRPKAPTVSIFKCFKCLRTCANMTRQTALEGTNSGIGGAQRSLLTAANS
ncbi:hypothetical protein B0H17DRAFT_1125193 [Mycena rosella]|uniref:Uncharacterized protein n=1 Tax=Mycena rosella TaxID=1033263 RepID=A0AAD7GXB4_MYCRO|nr:hypothetical protein B0H17DRAFT_1125193 [Mycena rosella]